jgi:hypothetical protein
MENKEIALVIEARRDKAEKWLGDSLAVVALAFAGLFLPSSPPSRGWLIGLRFVRVSA